MSLYRILSLDGGGIRGIYTAVLLQRLEERIPDLVDRVSLLAGTSTGGIIALGLARGFKIHEIVSLFQESGGEIFNTSRIGKLKDLGGLNGAGYNLRSLKGVLERVFNGTRLDDLEKRVLIPTFDLDDQREGVERTWKAKFFHNFPGPCSDGGESVVDVALRTSAAPTVFPSYQGFIDGGVVANNPSMAALAQALDRDTGNRTLTDVRLLSLGTGTVPFFIQGDQLNWGYRQWFKPLMKIMVDGAASVTHFQCMSLLRDRYHRLAPVLPERIRLDEVGKVDSLIAYAHEVKLDRTCAWLEEHF